MFALANPFRMLAGTFKSSKLDLAKISKSPLVSPKSIKRLIWRGSWRTSISRATRGSSGSSGCRGIWSSCGLVSLQNANLNPCLAVNRSVAWILNARVKNSLMLRSASSGRMTYSRKNENKIGKCVTRSKNQKPKISKITTCNPHLGCEFRFGRRCPNGFPIFSM